MANAVAPGKRPRSSMAPTLVFRNNGELPLVVGSPGGSRIINYVAKTLVATLDWNMDIQAAIALPNTGGRNGPTELERGAAAVASQVLAFWFLVPGSRGLLSVTSLLSEDLQSAAIGLGQMAGLIMAITLGVLFGTLLISPQKFVPVTVEAGGFLKR